MSKPTRDGAAEPVSRDQILRRERGRRIIHFPSSAADHEQDWQPCPDVTAIHTNIVLHTHTAVVAHIHICILYKDFVIFVCFSLLLPYYKNPFLDLGKKYCQVARTMY